MLTSLIGYTFLKVVWWFIIVVLGVGFFIMAGGDIAVGALLPFVARTDIERRMSLNAIGPTWEGNQTWFIVAGGAAFAVWPEIYSAAFSGFYIVLILVLFCLFMRPPCFDYRNKMPSPIWRNTWDWILFTTCFIVLILFGAAYGNLYLGVPFYYTPEDVRFFYTCGFFDLLTPFPILTGLFVLTGTMAHGAAILCLKTDDYVVKRARILGIACAALALLFFIAIILWIPHLSGYTIQSIGDVSQSLSIFSKTVVHEVGGWIQNYRAHPILTIFPIFAILSMGFYLCSMYHKKYLRALASSISGIVFVALSQAASAFPILMPSSSHPSQSLTIWDSCSSHYSLAIMLVVAIIMMPIILCYTAWIYRVMRGRITADDIRRNDKSLY